MLEWRKTLENLFETTIVLPDEPMPAGDHLPLSKFLEDSETEAFIRKQGKKHPELYVLGTLFAKRYTNLMMAVIWAAAKYDAALPVQIDQVMLRLREGGGYAFTLIGSPVKLDQTNRSDSWKRFFTSFLESHVTKVYESTAAATKGGLDTFWGLAGHNMQGVYLKLERELAAANDHRLGTVRGDREVVNSLAKPVTSKFRLYEPELEGESPFYIRTHCCLSYRTKDPAAPVYCNACPRMSDEARERKLQSRYQKI